MYSNDTHSCETDMYIVVEKFDIVGFVVVAQVLSLFSGGMYAAPMVHILVGEKCILQ